MPKRRRQNTQHEYPGESSEAGQYRQEGLLQIRITSNDEMITIGKSDFWADELFIDKIWVNIQSAARKSFPTSLSIDIPWLRHVSGNFTRLFIPMNQDTNTSTTREPIDAELIYDDTTTPDSLVTETGEAHDLTEILAVGDHMILHGNTATGNNFSIQASEIASIAYDGDVTTIGLLADTNPAFKNGLRVFGEKIVSKNISHVNQHQMIFKNKKTLIPGTFRSRVYEEGGTTLFSSHSIVIHIWVGLKRSDF